MGGCYGQSGKKKTFFFLNKNANDKTSECLKTEMLIILKKGGQWNHERKSNQLL